ncbi:aminotransferase class IV [Streptomyces sp. NPDC020875]|uniref:aminotransferase class IV n=1 Tax=Streptomyces sp. NPDC020875 TaxID=3154898 RepID=UPI0033EC2F01
MGHTPHTPPAPQTPHAPPAGRRLGWTPGRGFAPADTAPPGGLAAADSWLVAEGRVRGIGHHRDRFLGACRQEGLADEDLERFWRDLVAELPRTGSWFPRAELAPDGGLALLLRTAPELGTGIRVLPWPHPDPRLSPRRKGPDLELLAEVRARAVAAGADDALFTTADGRVTESTTAGLLWWDGPELVRPDATDHVLPSVTSALIERAAHRLGITVRPGRATPAELYDREVWLVNALHGIRPVTYWAGAGRPAAPAPRAGHWRRVLGETAEPLPAPPPRDDRCTDTPEPTRKGIPT